MRDASARGPLGAGHADPVAGVDTGDPIESRTDPPTITEAGGEPTDATDPRGIDEPTDAINIVVAVNDAPEIPAEDVPDEPEEGASDAADAALDSPAYAPPDEAVSEDDRELDGPRPMLSGVDLAHLGRDVPSSFDIMLTTPQGVMTLECAALLRVLPGRRIVVRARFDERAVVAKLFVGARASIEREWEERGHEAFIRADVASPELVGRGGLSGGGEALLYEYLDDAVPTTAADLPQTVPILARLHAHGVIQNDLHLGNVLRTARGLFLIDGGGVSGMGRDKPLSRRASVRNLALFLAQFDIRAESAFVAAWHAYAVARGYKTIDADGGALIAAVHRARTKRVRAYMKKVLRDCTEFHAEKRFDRFVVCDRASHRGELATWLDDIEARFATGTVIKAGNTATVAKVCVDGEALVVKRYNIKSAGHAVGRAWRPTRAQRAWQNAHRLRMLGIATFKPIALVERRAGPLRRSAYLVMRDVGGIDLRDRFTAKQVGPIVALFADLARAGLVHGDTKATNFVDVGDTIHLLDLDAMRAPRTQWGLRRGAAHDVARFIDNWTDSATIRAALSRAFGLAAFKSSDGSTKTR
jgi:tRNA A-37 threonylcarbamoyl transferase component Bud32